MAEHRPPRVFISYRHEPDRPEHADRVLALADRLRADGIDAVIDQYETAPPEGWPTWCEREIVRADFVLMVCTEAYRRTLDGEEPAGSGHGVLWEARFIRQLVYDAGSKTAKVVPALFADGVPEHVPWVVRGATRHSVETEEGFEDLYRQLTDQPKARKPELGILRKLAERPRQWREQPPAELHGVPELPPHFVPRPEALAALKEKLLGTDGGAVGDTGVAKKVGVQGMGGLGKSVLAAALTRDGDVRKAFPAGIFWITLGQTPHLLTRQEDLCELLAGKRSVFADVQQGRTAVQQALRERACLVVLDDVWQLADAEAFSVADTAAQLMLITRDADIVKKLGARKHEVDLLDRPASLLLLAQTADIGAEDLPTEADAIADQCGDLPLALALAGGMTGGRSDMWGFVLDALRQADIEQLEGEFRGYPYRHVFAAIEASVAALGADRERYLDLAIFPEKVPVPEVTLRALWSEADVGALKVHALMDRFRDRSLAVLDAQNRVTLHDLQRDFVRKRADDLPARHKRMLDAYSKLCPNGWASGPNDGYFFRYLPYHLVEASRRHDVTALLADYDWIAAKLRATDVQSVLSDYERAADEPDLRLIQRALRLSAHALARDPHHLPGQLTGRLGAFNEPRIRTLLANARTKADAPWLCPQTASLIPPGPLLQTWTGHTHPVLSLAVLADGRVVSGSVDGTLRVWDVASGESRALSGHRHAVASLAVLADGRVVSGSYDGTLRVWDVTSGESRELGIAPRRARPSDYTGAVTSLAVLADGRVMSGSDDTTLRVWDVTSGESRALTGHTGLVRSLAVLDDARVVSGSDDTTLRVWDVTSGESRALTGHTGRVRSLAVLDDARVVSGSDDHTLRVWDVTSGGSQAFTGHTGVVNSIAVLAGRQVVSCSSDYTLRVWDVASGESRALTGHTRAVISLAVLADGRVMSGSVDGTLRVWDVTNRESQVLTGHTSAVKSLVVLADGRLVSGSYGGTLRVWDVASGESRALTGHRAAVRSLAVLSDGRVVSGSEDTTVRVWDVASGESRAFVGCDWEITSLAVLADGRVVSGSSHGGLRVWDVTSGNYWDLAGHNPSVTSLAVLADGRLVSGSHNGTLRIWDVTSGNYWDLAGHNPGGVTLLGLLADGRVVSGCYEDSTVRAWDVTSGESRVLIGHTAGVISLAVLGAGRVVSGSWDWSAILWDVNWGSIAEFVGDARMTVCAAAGSGRIVVGSGNGAVHILELIEPKLA